MTAKRIYRWIEKFEKHSSIELRDRLKHEGRNPILRHLNVVVLFYTIMEALLRFFITLTNDPKDSYEFFYKHKGQKHHVPSFDGYRQMHGRVRLFTFTGAVVIVTSSMLVGLALNLATGVYRYAQAATFGWTQTSWVTLTSNTTSHPAPANWTEYSATTTNIALGASVVLTTTLASTTVDTSDTDFAQGATSSARVAGSGSSGYVELDISSLSWATSSIGGSTNRPNSRMAFATNTFPIAFTRVGGAVADLTTCTTATCTSQTTIPTTGARPWVSRIHLDSSGYPVVLHMNDISGTYYPAIFRCLNYSCSSKIETGAVNSRGMDVNVGLDSMLDSSGFGKFLYKDSLSGNITLLNCLNTNCTSTSSVTLATATSTANYSLAINTGADGFPRISWGLDNKMRFVQCLDANCSTNTLRYITIPSVTSHDYGSYMSVAGDGYPRLLAIFYNGSAYSSKFIRCFDANCASYTITNLYSTSTAAGLKFSDIAFAQNGLPQFLVKEGSYRDTYHIACLDSDCNTRSTTTISNVQLDFKGPSPQTAPMFAVDPNGLMVARSQQISVQNLYRQVPTYYSSGTFTSRAIDMGFGVPGWGNVGWTQTGGQTITMKVRTSATSDFSGATAWGSCSSIVNGGSVSGGGCATVGHRYAQYQASLSTADTTQSPVLNDVTISINQYASSQSVTSSQFDSGATENLMGGVLWTEDATLPAGTYVGMALRSASTSAGLTAAAWNEVSATSTNCSKLVQIVTCLSSAFPLALSDGVDDRWFQYRLRLSSTGGATPTVEDVTVRYVFNAAPTLQNVSATQQAGGQVLILYEVLDVDATTGSVTPGFVVPSFEYSTNSGGTWTPITGNLSAGATTSKAVSEVTWNTYTLDWTAKNILDGTFSTSTQIRVTVNDGEAASNIGRLASLDFSLDVKDPAFGVVPMSVQATYSPALVTIDVTDDSALEMRIGRPSDLSGISWVSAATTTTVSLVAEPDTVYGQFRDAYSNVSIIRSASSPRTPATMILRDLSNVSGATPVYRLFVSWGVVQIPGPGFANYRVYRSTDGASYSLYSTIASRSQNYLLDDNGGGSLDSATTYYYKVYTEDGDGNTSYYSSTVNDLPDGQGGTDSTPPSISSITSTTTTQVATINWVTDELSDSTVGYCVAPCAIFSTTQGVSSFVTSHEVVLAGLLPGTTYDYIVSSRDPSANSGDSSPQTFSTISGPSISNIAVTRSSNTEADVRWDTDIPASAYVAYATNTPPIEGFASLSGNATLATTRTVTLAGLTPGQTYYFFVQSRDGSNNLAEDKNVVNGVREYYKFNTSNDTSPPIISGVGTSTVTDIAAVVLWLTDEIANSTAEWGTSSSAYGSSTSLSTFDMTHFVELVGLSPLTTYYYRVLSADQNGNTATSSEMSFRTLEKQYGESQRVTQLIVYASARQPEGVSQSLYDEATKALEEARSALAKKTEELVAAIKELTDIKVEVLGLRVDEVTDPKALLRIVSEKFSSLTKVFENNATLDLSEKDLAPAAKTLRDLAEAVPPPIIKGAPQIDISSDKVTISWSSDKETNSIIAYAKKENYDATKENPYGDQAGVFDVYGVDHVVTLTNVLGTHIWRFSV